MDKIEISFHFTDFTHIEFHYYDFGQLSFDLFYGDLQWYKDNCSYYIIYGYN